MAAVSGVPNAGARVLHPELGAGAVVRARPDGRALMVRFDLHPSLLLQVKLSEVRVVEARPVVSTVSAPGVPPSPSTASAPGVPPSPSTASASIAPPEGSAPEAPVPRSMARPAVLSTGLFQRPVGEASVDPEASLKAAQAIEALRLGVVPHGDLRASSTGRDIELALARKDLVAAGTSGAARVFLGDYGTGKTHLLELLEYEALSQGFLVGRVTLDAQHVQPNQPMRVYRGLATSLRYPGSNDAAATGLGPLFEAATAGTRAGSEDGPFKNPLQDHLYLCPALHYFHALRGQDDPVPLDLLMDWIGGHRPEGNQELDASLRRLGRQGPTIYALKDFQPWAHVYAYLLGGLAFLARAQGYAGLVLLVDEAENYDLLDREGRSFADSLFKCLVLAALGPEGAPFTEASIDKGGFPPQKRLPTVYRWPQHLYLAAAMTPSTAGEGLLRSLLGPSRLTELSGLTPSDYQVLCQRISALYSVAYPQMRLPGRINQPLSEVLWGLLQRQLLSTPREATKLAVELMDLMRLRPASLGAFLADVEKALS